MSRRPLKILDLTWEQLRVVATLNRGEYFAATLMEMLELLMVPQMALWPEDFRQPPEKLRIVIERHEDARTPSEYVALQTCERCGQELRPYPHTRCAC